MLLLADPEAGLRGRVFSPQTQYCQYRTSPLLVKGSRDPSVRSEGLPTVFVAL